ncbi:hypothetical protein B0H13DRAFT_703918 [Mycena leptocephala]|nr:hypothetical protein B0H13DRAFT_703918 [Mycena leptocephala]
MCAMQHERQWTSRYTVGIPPRVSSAVRRVPSAQRTLRTLRQRLRPQAAGAEGREKRKKHRASSDFRHPSPSPAVHPLAHALSVSSRNSKPNHAALSGDECTETRGPARRAPARVDPAHIDVQRLCASSSARTWAHKRPAETPPVLPAHHESALYWRRSDCANPIHAHERTPLSPSRCCPAQPSAPGAEGRSNGRKQGKRTVHADSSCVPPRPSSATHSQASRALGVLDSERPGRSS